MSFDALQEVNRKRSLRDLVKPPFRTGSFTKRQKKQTLRGKASAMVKMLARATFVLQVFELALGKLADEKNWASQTKHFHACASREGQECNCAAVPEIFWVGDGDPLEIASKPLKAWREEHVPTARTESAALNGRRVDEANARANRALAEENPRSLAESEEGQKLLEEKADQGSIDRPADLASVGVGTV